MRLFPLSAINKSPLTANARAAIWLRGAEVAGPPSPGRTGETAGLGASCPLPATVWMLPNWLTRRTR
jgi:hypothetical protein